MGLNNIAIISPGDMGSDIGRYLIANGAEVYTCLAGRSDRTRDLSAKAGLIEVPSLEELIDTVHIVLSITISDTVGEVCEKVALAMRSTDSYPVFVDCNAISPEKCKQLEGIMKNVGSKFVDASILGGPPSRGGTMSGMAGKSPRVYYSGPSTDEFCSLAEFGLDLKYLGPHIGQASGIKMAYAAMNKGTTALYTELLLAASQMGIAEQLAEEFTTTQSDTYNRMNKMIPRMPAKARRWVSEMKEIESTFQELGMTGNIFKGVSEMYHMIGSTPIGNETPESQDPNRGLDETIDTIADFIQQHKD